MSLQIYFVIKTTQSKSWRTIFCLMFLHTG